MLLKKTFKGKEFLFNLPENIALELLKKDKRYSIASDTNQEPKKVKYGNDRK